MAELVDAPASGAGARKGVEVRVLFWAPDFCLPTPLYSHKTAEICHIGKCSSSECVSVSPDIYGLEGRKGDILVLPHFQNTLFFVEVLFFLTHQL